MTASFEGFQKLDICVGRITRAEPFPEARKAALPLWVGFGDLGEKRTSVQIARHHRPEELVGRQVLAVVNVPSAPNWPGPV